MFSFAWARRLVFLEVDVFLDDVFLDGIFMCLILLLGVSFLSKCPWVGVLEVRASSI